MNVQQTNLIQQRMRLFAALEEIEPGLSGVVGRMALCNVRTFLNEKLGSDVENDLLEVCMEKLADAAELKADSLTQDKRGG